MKYISTRGNESVSSAQAIKQGIAGDGGLFLPDKLPEINEDIISVLCRMDYAERAAEIMYMYLSDEYGKDELLLDCRAAYSAERFRGGAAPLKSLDGGIDVLELWHGPTAAFKDMALQIMPRLLSRALRKTGEERTAIILVATSGDTGKAALEGYRDVPGTKIIVFYPAHGVSAVQKLQMATQTGSNVRVCAIEGNFDDAQNGVKAIFADRAAAGELDSLGSFLSSANSINWGRLVPQTVYYISAYCDLVNSGKIKAGEKIDVCVPTGNFGNIFAAYLAKQSGLPIERLVCASNSNNVLTDFLESGIYDRRRKFHTTMSPSMDILISSNLERLLRFCGTPEQTAGYMKELAETGHYKVSDGIFAKIKRDFTGGFCTEEQTADEIRRCFFDENYLIDPHTAVALKCARENKESRRMLVASTASPYKFAKDVLVSLGQSAGNELSAQTELSAFTGVPVAYPLLGIEQRKVIFDPDDTIDCRDMYAEVRAFAKL